MINSANKYLISDILKNEGNVRYIIPKYQREYTWRKNEWELLFDDIITNDNGHFLGSIICINQSNDTLGVQELELVDGQQRLTTVSLLYAAIYNWLKEHKEEFDQDEIIVELTNLKNRMVLKSNKSMVRVSPSYQRYNYQDYCTVLEENEILQDVESAPNAGNRKMFKCYRYFLSRLNEERNGNPKLSSNQVLDLLNKINAAMLVKIEVSSHADAYTLFESLNNRGIPLSAVDLIKNKLLSVMEKRGINDLDSNFTKWNKLMNNLSDNYSVQERFLRQFYNAFKYKEEVAVERVSIATRSNIILIYQTLIDKNPQLIFNQLYEASKKYSLLILPDNEVNSALLSEKLQDLDRIGGAPSYILLLYLMEREIEDSLLISIVNFLVKFFVRRSITDTPPTRDLARMFMEIIENLESNGADIESFIKDTIKVKSASDDDFKKKLYGDVYEDNSWTTRFILCAIERENSTREIYTDLWERSEKGQFIWTVEHIFPQGENIPTEWVDLIANGNKKRAECLREKCVHKFGNLTLSGYNSKLGTLPFINKRDRKDKNNRYVGYKNGLYLNESLKYENIWSVGRIKNRTKIIVDLALSIFSLD